MFAFPNPKSTLQRFELRPKKSFGQNFLCDAGLVQKLARLVPERSLVVEIGAGLGGLTSVLLNDEHHVIAIERDRELLPVLRDTLGDALRSGQLTLIEDDAKQVDYASLMAAPSRNDSAAVRAGRVLMGNLPYNLTGPLLQRAITLAPQLQLAVFLVQLEVAERLAATPSTPQYGALTVFTRAAYHVQRAFIVKRGAFHPQPGVDSAVAVFTPRDDAIVETVAFRELVRCAFQQRRKTLRNTWGALAGVTPAEVEKAARACGISLDARGETLHVEDFARMSATLGGLRD